MCPKGVIALLLTWWVATDNVSGLMVLNLTRLKVLLFRPTLFWIKIGLLVSQKPRTVTIRSRGVKAMSPNSAAKKSMVRIICYIYLLLAFKTQSGLSGAALYAAGASSNNFITISTSNVWQALSRRFNRL